MFQNEVATLTYQGLLLILMLSGPPILISMVLGLIVAIFQAATQIQEQTLSFTIKLFAVIFTTIWLGSWLGTLIVQYTMSIISLIPKITP